MPEDTGVPFISSWKKQVASGPVTALANVGATNPGIAHNVAHLQHRGAKPLAGKSAPAIFAEAHHRETDHLRAAASHGSAAVIL